MTRIPSPIRWLVLGCLCLIPLYVSAQSWIPVPERTLSAQASSNLDWRDPVALKAGPRGDLYLGDAGSHQIFHLDEAGRLLAVRGGYGWDAGLFQFPVGLDASSGLDVWVADKENHRVQRLDKDLNFLSILSAGEGWPNETRFRRPLDVALSKLGELFVLDGDSRQVVRVNTRGEPVLAFGGLDAGEGRLERPCRMIALPGGRLAISDAGQQAVLLFTEEGDFLQAVGREVFQRPGALAVAEGRVLVALDDAQPCLCLFTLDGRLLTRWDADLLGKNVLEGAVDLTVHFPHLYLLNRRTRAVSVFRLHVNPAPWKP